MAKVSIIVPCYNQAIYLDETLQSVLDQTYTNWECIIVNDGSPDDTEKVTKQWCGKDSRFIYIHKQNGGLSSARNYGIQAAKGKFILTLDADDKYAPTFIEKALVILNGNNDIGIVSSWIIRFKDSKDICLIKPNGIVLQDFLFQNSANGTSLFKKECWEQVGGYDEKMKWGYEDWEFYIRVCQLGWKMHVIQEPLFFYRQHDISMRTVALNDYDVEIKKYIYYKHEILYKEHYEDLIAYFLWSVASEKKQNIKIQNRIDYRIGTTVLKPFRFIKSFFKK
ncbi:MAG: glycosyltransferase family 2 protein [Flavobacterium sp.]|nr:glycosyltransferase family 2 protein [Flavobacterium sp.]